MTLPSDEAITAAYRAGRLSARAGRDLDTCPFNANGTGEQRVLARRWVMGYLDGGGRTETDYSSDEPGEL